ncbi:Undecaprenyl-phosphate glucose phosphotransferase [Novosphingobium sp. SG751A]|uniref:undecaprenyl-phosphate glucose phosphotransferase n=1 Tax=Novosphingobium sp. SG751A TaxID=2587000 RepID=UPI0015573946|nr:undecaprenyl-phosphate glucose phosphotransferase [Novosphingobium sp. SG751A]NOW46443.1 Undecaprenyl-phosphate glucose phosphotransferase [Novosphingobium sp. SG751A]
MATYRPDQQVADERAIVPPLVSGSPSRRWTCPVQYMQCLVCFLDIALIVAATTALRLLLPLLGDHAATLRLDRIGIMAGALFALIAQLVGAYDLPVQLSAGRSAMRAAHAWTGVTLFAAGAAMTMLDLVRIAPEAIALWFLACGLSLMAGRGAMAGIMRHLRRQGLFDQRSAVIGTGRDAAALLRYISEHKLLNLKLIGFFGEVPAPGRPDGALPYRGDFDALLLAIRDGAVTRVIIAMPAGRERQIRAMVARLAQTPVEVRLAPVGEGLWTRHSLAVLGEMPVVTLQQWPLSRHQRLLKAGEDWVLALIALVALMPVMVVVAAMIRLDSPGPILFRQQRQGFNCRTFGILKFRTMRAEDDGGDAVVQARRNDARVTRVGAILRRTSLDELPQLINVLRGDMSLVGPRPHAPSTRAAGRLFGDIAQSYPSRHNVKPGMTGWAQVCGWRGETHSEEQLLGRLEHDLFYVRNWSIWFDMRIMVRTIAIVLRQQNAY